MLVYDDTAIGGEMLSYMLLRTRLVPRALSVLGLIGYPALFVAAVLDMLGIVDTVGGLGLVGLVPGGLLDVKASYGTTADSKKCKIGVDPLPQGCCLGWGAIQDSRRPDMAETKTAVANTPTWIDLATTDAAAAREFYSKLFGWKIEVNPDPQYGGYGMGELAGKRVAGIGPKMSPDAPTSWSIYIATDDVDALAKKAETAGGKLVAPPFDVGDQGRMAAIQDPSGAVISIWQARSMNSAMPIGEANTFGWAELSARGVNKAIPFYQKVFGWTTKTNDMGPDAPPYYEFQLGGESVAGGQEMQPMVPADVPSYWLVYFTVADVDKSFKTATQAGARELVAPMDFPGGRFAILTDPQGASFGLLKMAPR